MPETRPSVATAPDGRAPPGSASRVVVWVVGFFAFLNVYSIQAVLPLIMQDFQATPLQAGLAVGSTVLAIGVVSPFMGMLSDAMGRRNIICVCMFAVCVPTALIPLSHDLYMLIALRFLQGLAVPGIVVVLIAYISEEFAGAGVTTTTASYVGGTVMGGFSGRFITGHAGEWLGWRGAFYVLALLNLGGALFVLLRLPASRGFVPNRNFVAGFETLWKHLHHRRLMAACAVGFCVLFSLVGTFTYINLHLAAPPFALSAAGLANVFTVYLVGVLVTPMASRHLEKLGFMRSMLWSLGISCAGLLITLIPILPLVAIGLAVCATGVFLCQSSTISAIAKNITHGRSLATGIYYMCYYAGGAAGAWLAGLAYERYAWPGSVATIAVIQMVAASLVYAIWRSPSPTASAA